MDYLRELTELDWYRKKDRWESPEKAASEKAASEVDPAEDVSKEDSHSPEIDLKSDPVALQLQRIVGVYNYRSNYQPEEWSSADYSDWCVHGDSEPRIFYGSKLLSSLAPKDKLSEGELHEYPEGPEGWPATQKEMEERLERLIPVFQTKPHPFYNYSWANECEMVGVMYMREERLFAETFLHAEVWGSDSHSESMWVFVALWPGQRVPDWHIEKLVYEVVRHMLDEEAMTPEQKRQREEKRAREAQYERLEQLFFEKDDAFDKEVEEYGREEFWEQFDECWGPYFSE